MGATQGTINSVQNSIVNGMANVGYSQAQTLAAIAALEALGLPITEAAVIAQLQNGGCP